VRKTPVHNDVIWVTLPLVVTEQELIAPILVIISPKLYCNTSWEFEKRI